MLELILEPLSYTFMVRGFIAAILVGIVSAVVGSYVMLRGMAFFGDALAHTILPGVAIGYLTGGGNRGPMFWWALVTAIGASFIIGTISKEANVREDTAISIVFAAMFALGIGLISTMRGYAVDLVHILFGNILGINNDDLWRIGIVSVLIILTIIALYKEFLLISFDPIMAKTLRLPMNWLNHLLLALIAITIVISLQAVGIALMLAMLITPAATAYLLTQRLHTMMLTGAAIGAISGCIGLYLSYYISIASGPAIVLVCTLFFILAMLFAPQRGWVWRMQKH